MSSNVVAEPSAPLARLSWASRAEIRLRQLPAWWSLVVLALLLLGGAALLAHEARGTIFSDDEWVWILNRRGDSLSVFLDPHNSHLSLVPVVIYKLLFAAVGLRHYWPYRAIGVGAHLLCVALIYVYVRPRLGSYLALVAALLILLFGPGWQNMLWPFQMAWLFSVAAGIGALLALERPGRWWSLGACLLTVLSLASAGPGLAVALAVLLEVLWRRPRREWWIAIVPLALYAIWALGYQQTMLNRHAFVLLPHFVFAAAGGALSSLVGLSGDDVLNNGGSFLEWGAPLLVAALIGLVARVRRQPAPPLRLLALAVLLLSFWLLTGIGRAYVSFGAHTLTSTGDESRYLYVSAVFILLLLAEVIRGWRPGLAVGALVGIAAVAAVVSNLGPLRDGGRLLRDQSQQRLGLLASLDISRQIVSPDFVSNGFIFGILNARGLFAAERALGSPLHAPPVAVLAQLPAAARAVVDGQFADIQSLRLEPISSRVPAAGVAPPVEAVQLGTATSHQGCATMVPGGAVPAGATSLMNITIPPDGVVVRSGSTAATVTIRRFGDTFRPLGVVEPHAVALLRPRHDLAPELWHAQIQSATPVSGCGFAARPS